MPAIGVNMFPTDYAIQPVELARAIEERGFESLWVCEHTHIPTSRETPWPAGGDLPLEYSHTHDPFVALAAAAAATERIKLGTAITLVTEHSPFNLAKSVASLDMISNGRMLLGVGAGWNKEEMADHGVAFKDRWQVTRERVLAVRALWTQEEAEFHGAFVDFDKTWCYPKPVQPGGVPVLLGATSDWSAERVVDYCDGWLPNARFGRETLRRRMEELRAVADRAGRSFEAIQKTVFWPPADAETINDYFEMGFDRAVLSLPPAPADEALPILDEQAKLLEQF